MNKTFTDEEIKTAYKELQIEGKIHLGAIEDLWKLWDKVEPYNNSAMKNIKSAQEDYKKAIKIWEQMNKEATKLLPIAEDLGVKEAVKKIKRAKSESSKMKKMFEKDLNTLKQLA